MCAKCAIFISPFFNIISFTFKIAFSKMIQSVKNETPTLLLDDVLGELDENRQNNLLDYIRNYQQVILSTSTLADVKKENLENANIIELE